MKHLHLLIMLAALMMPWATNAQNTQTFGFEDNAIPAGWTNDATYPWVVTSTAPQTGYVGTYCIKSGNAGVSSSTSSISATFTFQDDGSISFLGGCWGEGTSSIWDACSFSIDNVEQFSYGALQTWATYTFQVSAGTHTFTWSYSKDGSVDPTGDGFFVDSVVVDLGAIQTCPRPTALTANYVGGTNALLSWTSDATAWQVCVNNDSTHLVNATTNPFNLTGLTPLTTYTVKVRTDCGTETSRWSNPITFTTDVACPAPADLAVVPGSTTAEVSWMGFANSYTLEYVEFDTSSMGTPTELQYDNDTLATNIGNSSTSTFTWGVKYPASMISGTGFLTKVSLYETNYNVNPITVNIYAGGDTVPGTLLYTETVTPLSNGFHEVTLASPVQFDSVQNIWITLTETGTYIMAACNINAANNQWVYTGSSWASIGDLASSLAGYGWMIRGTYVAGNISSTAWTTVTNATSPHTLTGLTPETQYMVRVKGNCGTDGESAWANGGFVTLEGNPIPMDVVVNPSATTADVSWRGYSDSYKVYYRLPATDVVSFSEDFENGIDSTWTIYTVGEAPQTNGWYTINPESGLSFSAHGGSMVASAWSWSSMAYNADNWLVTPQVTLGGTLKYWERTNASYPDHYEVVVSTTGNTIANFNSGTVVRARAIATANGEWNEVSIDLSAFSGQAGYIAFHHADTDANYLLIDDITLVSSTIPASAWLDVTTTTTNATLTGLTPSTTYEYKVSGIASGVENAGTPIATFTTEAGDSTIIATVVENIETCDSYTWRGTTYTASTTETDTVYTPTGVDSIYVLYLTIHYSVYDTVTVTARDQYVWNDSVYTSSGVYDYYGETSAGCDSIVTLLLTIDSTADVYYSVAVVIANTEGELNVGGQVIGAGSYVAGSEVTLIAVPDSGYLFDGWYTRSDMGFGGELISDDSVYVFTLEENVVVVAMFERIGANSALLTVSVDSTLGQVLFNGQQMPFNVYRGTLGETVTLEAIANDNCQFLGWVNTLGDTISRDAVYDYVLDQTTSTLTAAFVRHEGINAVDASNVTIFARENGVVVRGAAQAEVYVFDVVGRLVGHVSAASDEEFIRLPQTGVYLVKVGDLPARRVVVRQ